MSRGMLPAVGMVNSVMVPVGVIRPTLLPACSTNQMLPSGPSVMPTGALLAVGIVNSPTTTPAVLTSPILFPPRSVNQRLPLAPFAMSKGVLAAVGTGNSAIEAASNWRPSRFSTEGCRRRRSELRWATRCGVETGLKDSGEAKHRLPILSSGVERERTAPYAEKIVLRPAGLPWGRIRDDRVLEVLDQLSSSLVMPSTRKAAA